jgi:hypothetical protein
MAASGDSDLVALSRVGELHFQVYAGLRGQPVRWRLLSGNNRDAGRSVQSFADLEDCMSSIKEVLARLDALEPAIVPAADGRGWRWRLSLDGVPVVAAPHAFDRRIRCAEACARFVHLAPLALIRAELVRLVSDGGSATLDAGAAR